MRWFSDRWEQMFSDWDKVRATKDCLHCHGTGKAPSGDGRTPCGFCEENGDEQP